jgi:hypothetical protein
MANILQDLLGAGAGFLSGGPVGAVLGGVGSLLSHRPHEDPVAQQQRLFQQGIANRLLGFSQGVPGSDPGEIAALAQARGNLGADQRQYEQGIFGQFNPQMRTSLADMASNLASRFAGQQMALQEAQMTAALQARRDALLQAAKVAPTGKPQYEPASQLPELMKTLAQSLAYQQAKRKAGAQDQAQPGGFPTPDPSNPQNSGVFPGSGGPTAQYPGSTPMPGGGGPMLGSSGAVANAPGSSGAVPDFLGALPKPLYMQDQATTQGMTPFMQPNLSGGVSPNPGAFQGPGPTLGDQTYAAQQGALPNVGNAPGGQNSTANQWRQSAGLNNPPPWWQGLADPYGLKYGT